MPAQRKAEHELARPRSRKGKQFSETITRLPGATWSDPPPPDPDWHPIYVAIYKAALESPMSTTWCQTDIGTLWDNCAYGSRNLTSPRPSAQMKAAVDASFARLGLAVGDRLKLRLELESEERADAAVDATTELSTAMTDLAASMKGTK